MKAALALLKRDVRLALREGGAIGTALGFYLMVVAITPLGLGPDLNLLSRIAPGMLWIALLLAALLSADRIFHNDYEDGALDVLITGRCRCRSSPRSRASPIGSPPACRSR